MRRFQSEWYKKYPWISYEVANDACVCFACVEFGKDTSFVFRNWKKSEKLAKHGKSENHVRSMTRWLQFKAMQRNQTSVLQQLNSAHQDQVACKYILLNGLTYNPAEYFTSFERIFPSPERARKNARNE